MENTYNTLYLVDISSFIFRAFYAIREMSTPDGTPINAVYGVASMLGRLIEDANPKYLAVVYDSKEPSFRKLKYEEYKANRSAPPETLVPQFELIEELIRVMGIPTFRQSGVEADDLIATLHKRWLDEAATATQGRDAMGSNHRVVVVSGDKDLMALVSSRSQLWDTMKDIHYTPHEVIEKFGVTPDQIRDYLAIVGDTSDNIPGITGIGPKGAELLLKEFKTLEEVIKAAKAGKVKGKKGELIVECEKAALLSQELATLKDDCELDLSVEGARFDFKVKPELLEFLKKYNLRAIYSKYAKMAPELVKSGDFPEALDTSANSSVGVSAAAGGTGVGSAYGERGNAKPVVSADSLTSAPSAATTASSTKSKKTADSSEQNTFEFAFDAQLSMTPSPPVNLVAPAGGLNFVTVATLPELRALIAEVKKRGLMSFDTETTSLNVREAKLVGMAIAVDEKGGYYIPVGHAQRLDSKISQLDLAEVLKELRPILESKEIKKIGQNLKYDFRILANHGIVVQGLYADTMVAAYALDSSGRHNLDFLCKKYLNYDVVSYEDVVGKGASQVTFDQVSIETATRYSAEDAWCAYQLWQVLEPKLKEQGVEKLFHEVDLPMVETVAAMEDAGIEVDVPFLQKIEKQFEKEMQVIEAQVHALAKNPAMNLNSPKQLAQFLFEELKLPTQGKTKTGFSTDASVLEKLAPLHEAPRLLLEYREISKLKGTYVLPLQELRDKQDSRIRTSFHLTGTATGRLSSSDPNLQNIPTRSKRGQLIREAFIAAEDSVLISADYSQIELRILAHLSGDPSLVSSFVTGEDVHRRTASEIYHITTDQVTDLQRSVAKAINFGLMYGKGAFALAEELAISRGEAKKMIDEYFTRYSRVKEFLDSQIELAKERGYLVTLLGRKRALPEIRSTNHAVRANAERMAMNSPIQGTASDLIKVAMVELHRALETQKLKTKLLLQVHDELVLEAPKNEVDVVSALVTRVMEGALKLKVPLQVNVNVGKNWAEL
jgi:DNA polymerase-1